MKKGLVFFLLALCAAGLSFGQDDYAQWLYFKNIGINTKASGANVPGSVANFPVLVRLTSTQADVFAQSKRGGADIRFSNAAGKHLPYQIERWDSAGQAAAVWVLADTVKGNDSAASLRLHWGRSAALDSSSGRRVFDTTLGYEGVWHFSEAASDTAFDATANDLKAAQGRSSASESFPADTAGVIGRAREYGAGASTSEAIGSYYTVLNTASATTPVSFAENGIYTISTWVNLTEKGIVRTVLSKGNTLYYLELRETGNQWDFAEYHDAVGWDHSRATSEATLAGSWQYLTAVSNGTAQSLYLNGVLATNAITPEAGTGVRNTGRELAFGRNPSSTNRYFRGRIDEINIASRARSNDWVKLSFETQKPSATAITLGATQPSTPPSGIGASNALIAGDLSITAPGNGLLFQIPAGSVRAQAALTDMWGRTVWSEGFKAGVNRLAWDGRGSNGQALSSGVYVARITLLDGQNKVLRALERKIPLTR